MCRSAKEFLVRHKHRSAKDVKEMDCQTAMNEAEEEGWKERQIANERARRAAAARADAKKRREEQEAKQRDAQEEAERERRRQIDDARRQENLNRQKAERDRRYAEEENQRQQQEAVRERDAERAGQIRENADKLGNDLRRVADAAIPHARRGELNETIAKAHADEYRARADGLDEAAAANRREGNHQVARELEQAASDHRTAAAAMENAIRINRTASPRPSDQAEPRPRVEDSDDRPLPAPDRAPRFEPPPGHATPAPGPSDVEKQALRTESERDAEAAVANARGLETLDRLLGAPVPRGRDTDTGALPAPSGSQALAGRYGAPPAGVAGSALASRYSRPPGAADGAGRADPSRPALVDRYSAARTDGARRPSAPSQADLASEARQSMRVMGYLDQTERLEGTKASLSQSYKNMDYYQRVAAAAARQAGLPDPQMDGAGGNVADRVFRSAGTIVDTVIPSKSVVGASYDVKTGRFTLPVSVDGRAAGESFAKDLLGDPPALVRVASGVLNVVDRGRALGNAVIGVTEIWSEETAYEAAHRTLVLMQARAAWEEREAALFKSYMGARDAKSASADRYLNASRAAGRTRHEIDLALNTCPTKLIEHFRPLVGR